MAVGADIGIDSTISLLSDLAITGQIDLSAEGVSQLISQLTGVLASKAAAKRTKANTAEISTSQKTKTTIIIKQERQIIPVILKSFCNLQKSKMKCVLMSINL